LTLRVGLVYNEPIIDRYTQMGEADAIADVLEEVTAVNKALLDMGYQVTKLGLVPPLDECRPLVQEMPVDIYFNLFEGFAGRPETEAMLAGIMSVTGKPLTGSQPATLALALDKVKTKQMLFAAGVLTPGYQVFRQPDITSFQLNYPVIVKPAAEDASHGVTQDSVVRDAAALKRQIERICAGYGGIALVEEFIDGRELSATIMGNQKPIVLSISEIVFTLPPELPRVLTFAAKWTPGDIYFENTDPVCPAQVEKALWDHIAETSIKAFRLTGCRGYARVDMRVDDQGRAHVLEVNPNPDISLTSGAVRQAAAIGLSYPQFVDRIVKLAMGEE
jgi:D-alanine-D-alanine ligase